MLPGNLPHIGVVTNETDPISGNPLIVHNIGAGPKLEDKYNVHYDDYILGTVVKSPTIAYFFEVGFLTGMNIPQNQSK